MKPLVEVKHLPLQDNNGRLLKEMAAARDNLDSLFAELDVSLAQSRQVFSQVAATGAPMRMSAQYDSSAAMTSMAGPAADSRSTTEDAAPAVQVPAYVHVGDPLVSDEPAKAAQLCAHSVHW